MLNRKKDAGVSQQIAIAKEVAKKTQKDVSIED
jgi:hypothetical protein